MPFGHEGVEPGVGLALSGGGFRATLFHVGSLWRLNELGFLPRLVRVSSVSGGSITSGVLASRWGGLVFAGDVATNFQAEVVDPLRRFCARSIDGPAIGEGALLPGKRASEAVQEQYEEHLFGKATLQDLPDAPRFVFNATNFQTGNSFRFSKPYAGDYRLGLLPRPTCRLALAVAASSAFPPFLSPVVLETKTAAFQPVDGADLNGQPDYCRKLHLTDGGVYDNLGLETVWNRCETVLVSDAGAPLETQKERIDSWKDQALRAMDVATNQARALRKRALIDDFRRQERRGTYWGIATEIAGYGIDALPVDPARARELATMRTRLNPFDEREQCRLINGGYALCDAALRRYVLAGTAVPSPAWPYPRFALG